MEKLGRFYDHQELEGGFSALLPFLTWTNRVVQRFNGKLNVPIYFMGTVPTFKWGKSVEEEKGQDVLCL